MMYAIVNSLDLENLDFSKLENSNKNNLMTNNDKSLSIVKFKGEIPLTLANIKLVRFGGREIHSQRQMIRMKEIVSNNPSFGWVKLEV